VIRRGKAAVEEWLTSEYDIVLNPVLIEIAAIHLIECASSKVHHPRFPALPFTSQYNLIPRVRGRGGFIRRRESVETHAVAWAKEPCVDFRERKRRQALEIDTRGGIVPIAEAHKGDKKEHEQTDHLGKPHAAVIVSGPLQCRLTR
jgi:hypothetical protein